MPVKKVKKSTDYSLQSTEKQEKQTVVGRRKTVDKKIITKQGSLSVPVFSLAGISTGTLTLPKEIFGAEVNKSLLAQALRVYSTNQKTHWANTKTRGEVTGSSRKIYRQKGTGKARAGSIRGPVRVGGGIAFGPKFRKTTLELPKKMRKAALVSALSAKAKNNEIAAVDGLEKATGKTKQMFKLFKGLEKKNTLVVNDQKLDPASRAIRNIPGFSFLTVSELNAYEIISHQSLLLTKAAVERLQGKSTDYGLQSTFAEQRQALLTEKKGKDAVVGRQRRASPSEGRRKTVDKKGVKK